MGCGASSPVGVNSSPVVVHATKASAVETAARNVSESTKEPPSTHEAVPTVKAFVPSLSDFMAGLAHRGIICSVQAPVASNKQGDLLGVSIDVLQAISELVGPHVSSQEVFQELLLPAVRQAGATR